MLPAPCPLRGSAAPLLIRADAGGALGTGHVMRMLALAQAWIAQGETVHMAILSCPAPLQDRLRNEGIHLHTLNDNQRGSSDDASQLAALADSLHPAWIVLDGYDFDLDYQRRVKNAGFKLMVMDDYGYSPTWCADLILNQNLGAESFAYTNEIPNSRTLLGTHYVLLRKEFWNAAPKHAEHGKSIQNLLITLGGVDADNVTGKVLEALEEAASHKLNLRVLLGPGNPHLQALKTLSSNSRHEITFLQNVSDMPSQYLWTDGVISAGGSTCYEWSRFGLPAAVIQIADNQAEIYNRLNSTGYAIGLGNFTHQTQKVDVPLLVNWLRSPAGPATTQALVDGSGGHRVCGAMHQSSFYLRFATFEDALAFYKLANDPAVRKWSLNPQPFSWETHISWFLKKLEDTESVILSVCDIASNLFAGYVRFELTDLQDWLISYALNPDYRGKGLGKSVLETAMRFLEVHRSAKLSFTGQVHKNNIPSTRIFQSLGFDELSSPETLTDFTTYQLRIS